MINTLYTHSAGYPHHAGVAVICSCWCRSSRATLDPLVMSVMPDASGAASDIVCQCGFDKPLPLQFIHWLWRALHGDSSVGRHRPPGDERSDDRGGLLCAWRCWRRRSVCLGGLFGFVGVAGYFRNSVIDRLASVLSFVGVPHYWLGMLLVILCSVKFALLPLPAAGR